MKRRESNVFNIAFLDLLSGALGAVIILYVAVPKSQNKEIPKEQAKVEELKQERDFQEDLQKRLEKRLAEVEKQKSEIQKENEKLKKKLVEQQKNSKNKKDKDQLKTMDVGFNFQGQKIVFLLDISGSMYLEDRIGQVKAGLKMLITSMAPHYEIDVVVFPDGPRSLFRPLWGNLKETTKSNKKEVYQFLLNIKPFGATPTQDAINYALENYRGLTDIVLLSDGTPTMGNSRKVASISKILQETKKNNQGKEVQINTIGVGSDFLEDTDNKKYIFLNKLAKQNKGFFVGF